MKKFIQNKLKDQKGLTLIELLAVIVIIAIIAAIAIPAIGNIIDNSRNGAVKADFQNALAAANLYVTEEGNLPTAGATLTDLAPYIEEKGSLTEVTVTRAGTEADGSLQIVGKATANSKDYTITTALTNAQLGGIPNSAFEGTSITPALVEE